MRTRFIAMQGRGWVALLAAGLVTGAAACGGGGSGGGSSLGVESRSAAQIFDAALAAAKAQPVMHMTVTTSDSSGSETVEGVFTANSGRVTQGDSVMLFVGGTAYVGVVGGSFMKVPEDQVAASPISTMTIHGMMSCARAQHGALTKGAVSTLSGKRVIAIADDGKAPGAMAGTWYVALDGPTLPVRTVFAGPTTPGGSTACGGPRDASVKETTDIEYSVGSVTLTPPAVVATPPITVGETPALAAINSSPPPGYVYADAQPAVVDQMKAWLSNNPVTQDMTGSSVHRIVRANDREVVAVLVLLQLGPSSSTFPDAARTMLEWLSPTGAVTEAKIIDSLGKTVTWIKAPINVSGSAWTAYVALHGDVLFLVTGPNAAAIERFLTV